jgi:large subunit ribosomal protein L4
LEVKFALIENGKGTQAVHDAVVAYLANQRMGTACTKNVGEVAGTNKKPWRQKGTGRARAGSFRSPLWRGGGVVFGPKPRDFGRKVSKSTKQLALRKALSERLKSGDVVVVDDFKLDSPKTKTFVGVLKALQLEGTTLIVASGQDKNLSLASRNVPDIELATSDSLNTYQVLRFGRLVFTRSAFEQVEQRLAAKPA